VSVSPCPTCHGEGREVRDPCTNCAGRGLEQKERTIEVEVPAGVSSGDYLTLRGQGHAAPNNGARGDILVVMDVQDDERFSRDGPNLLYELGITFSQAALGADLEVPTVTGNTRVEVPPGTQSGHVIRLRGKGLPQLQGGGRGDLLVRVTVWTPTRLSAEQEKVFRALAEVETEKPQTAARGGDGGFWSRVKEAFGG
jgi:molecular chaperone DnaJ